MLRYGYIGNIGKAFMKSALSWIGTGERQHGDKSSEFGDRNQQSIEIPRKLINIYSTLVGAENRAINKIVQ